MLFRENIFKREKKENKKIIAQGSGQWLPQGKINGFETFKICDQKGAHGEIFLGGWKYLITDLRIGIFTL